MPRSRMILCLALIFSLLVAVAVPQRAAADEVTAGQVRDRIDQAVAFLKRRQHPKNGNWSELGKNMPGGVSALCLLALLNAGVAPDDPVIQRGLTYLRADDEPSRVYTSALRIMVYAAAGEKIDLPRIRRHADGLIGAQITDDKKLDGAWGYMIRRRDDGGYTGSRDGDSSNSQFALLGLYEAERAGVKIPRVVWERAVGFWTRTQYDNGAWAYKRHVFQENTLAMTCAGVASLIIASGRYSRGRATIDENGINCCGGPNQDEIDRRIDKGLRWLGEHLQIPPRQGFPRRGRPKPTFYYLYALERVGRLTGQRFFYDRSDGKKTPRDWYREGAEFLVDSRRLGGGWQGQHYQENHPEIATAFALLFLAKGRRPVVMAKLATGGDDWNRHPADAANLTRFTEKQWKRDLSWQVFDLDGSSLEDLLQAPVLYVSGSDGFRLTDAQQELLKRYVEQGGFIFAVSTTGCGGPSKFPEEFRQSMSRLLQGQFRPLPDDHPVWYSEIRIPETLQDRLRTRVTALQACCRTSVILVEDNAACHWELWQPNRYQKIPAVLESQINAYAALGVNILAYATGRELKNKLDQPKLVEPTELPPLTRDAIFIAKIDHTGGADEAQQALPTLLKTVYSATQIRVRPADRLVSLGDTDSLARYPILFMHGRRGFSFSAEQRKALKEYLKAGGFLFADSICASSSFENSFRREMEAIFGENALQPIPADHKMLTEEYEGHDLSRVTLRDPQLRAQGAKLEAQKIIGPPRLEAVRIGSAEEGRIAVVFSPYDISCAMENPKSIDCKGYIRDDAAKIGANVILYALQQ